MSNLWFNIRFGIRHWQWGPNGMSWRINLAQVIQRNANLKDWKWFEAYTVFGRHL